MKDDNWHKNVNNLYNNLLSAYFQFLDDLDQEKEHENFIASNMAAIERFTVKIIEGLCLLDLSKTGKATKKRILQILVKRFNEHIDNEK
jgi:hypothetical protein